MRGRNPRLAFVPVLGLLVSPALLRGLNQPHLDLDSLTYLSTDIVLATLSVEAPQRFTATVTETLYGSLPPGEKLTTLSDFLGFFAPMDDGQRVILFLDRRPRQANFLYPEASKSPFGVPPSGVYLIDAYEHVHEYHQNSNPGPYEAQGYSYMFGRSVPTKEQDLALPTLKDNKAR